MSNKLSTKTQEDLKFIDDLCEKEIISWPIDYEPYHPTNEELSETLGHWFGSDKWSKSGDSFLQLGQDGTGSLFCLWFYPGLKAEPPVVFLGSEGESSLVASNTSDFIRQLSSGKLFFDGDWLDPEPEDKDELDWKKLKSMAAKYLGEIDFEPEQLRDNALKKHPDFSAWVESKIDY